jgi:hypothetical protein
MLYENRTSPEMDETLENKGYSREKTAGLASKSKCHGFFISKKWRYKW